MGYTVVKSFERGLDTRRMIDITDPGGLLVGKDCHVTRGGEIEKRAAFVVTDTLPAGSVGFYATPNPPGGIGPMFHCWGEAADPGELSPNVVYHSIPYPGFPGVAEDYTLVSIQSVEEFAGKLFVLAEYEHDDGTRVTVAWYFDDSGPIALRTYIHIDDEGGGSDTGGGATGTKPSATFTYSTITELVAGEVIPKITKLSRAYLLKPSTTYNFTGTPPDAYEIIDHTGVDGVGRPAISPSEELGRLYAPEVVGILVDRIQGYTTAGVEVTAAQAGNQLVVRVDVEGTTYNGWSIFISTTGINVSPGSTAALSGGLDRPAGGGEPEPEEGDPPPLLQLGTYALAHNTKLYTVNGSKIFISASTDATHWDGAHFAGADVIDATMVAEGTPIFLAMADYQGDLAFFGKKHILIYQMDPDPELNIKRQTLHRIGIIAPHALVPYGEGDVMFLARSGIRSLRTRQGVDEAFAADLGTPIDDLVQAKIEESDNDIRINNFWAEVEPRHGRLWMALHDKIFVLSWFPESRISAWTIYDVSAYPIGMLNAADDRVYWRSGNNVIVYSGDDGETYDATEAIAQIPYIDGGKIATHKNWEAIDVAAIGNWQVRASFDPTQPTEFDLIANITKSTYTQQKIAMNGESPSVSLELRTTMASAARIGNATLHYSDSTAD